MTSIFCLACNTLHTHAHAYTGNGHHALRFYYAYTCTHIHLCFKKANNLSNIMAKHLSTFHL